MNMTTNYDDINEDDRMLINDLIPQNLYDREKLILLMTANKKYNLDQLKDKLGINNDEI